MAKEKIISGDKRLQILTSTVAVFAKDGFDQTTVDSIALQAKVAKGTVYYYFKSKEEIFYALIEEGVAKFCDTIEKETKLIQDPIKKVEKFIETEISFLKEYQDFFRVLVGEWNRMESRWGRNTDEIQKKCYSVIEKILKENQENGTIKRDIDTSIAASSLFWCIAMVVTNWLNFKNENSEQQITTNLKNLILNGIVA